MATVFFLRLYVTALVMDADQCHRHNLAHNHQDTVQETERD